MNKLFSLLLGLFCICYTQAQVTIVLTSIPHNTPANASIYLAGNMNSWNDGDSNFILQTLPNNQRFITLQNPPANMEFKFTRGDWANVEGDNQGCEIGNRTASPSAGDTLRLAVATWKDLTPCSGGPNSTANGQMSIMDPAFDMPQLSRKRKIWIYLPPDYASSNKRYPVMYMQDGQNLFDRATSFSGEWGVDETLTGLFQNGDPGIIIIGIDNGGSERLNEYSPWFQQGLGGGQGDAYLDFMVNTLKPYVDLNFRTKSDAANTGILGSSMGGLISLYAGLKRPDIYGRVGVFSPSVWFAPQIWNTIDSAQFDASQRYYILAGGREGSNLPADAQRLEQKLIQKGHTSTSVFRQFDANGSHTESFWAAWFGPAYEWLFAITTELNTLPEALLRVFPNPVTDTLRVEYPGNYHVKLYDALGKLLFEQDANEGHLLSFSQYPAGSYVLHIFQDGKSRTIAVWKK
ncbi:MAG: alpha/beta hydrolase-fold protein [Bacteroidia bacterium]